MLALCATFSLGTAAMPVQTGGALEGIGSHGSVRVAEAPKTHRLGDAHPKGHADIERVLALEEALCYQRFAVNDCLLEARAKARAERAALNAQEHIKKAAVRRARSAEHQRDLALQQNPQEPASATASAPGVQAPVQRKNRNARAPQVTRERAKALPRPRSTGTNAEDLQQAREERRAAKAQRDAHAVQARERLKEKRATAAKRQAAAAKRQSDREAAGHLPPAPLPQRDGVAAQ